MGGWEGSVNINVMNTTACDAVTLTQTGHGGLAGDCNVERLLSAAGEVNKLKEFREIVW